MTSTGVHKDASEDDIKKAYRKQAMKHDPDRNQGKGDEKVIQSLGREKFKEARKPTSTFETRTRKRRMTASVTPSRSEHGWLSAAAPAQMASASFADAFGDIRWHFGAWRCRPCGRSKRGVSRR